MSGFRRYGQNPYWSRKIAKQNAAEEDSVIPTKVGRTAGKRPATIAVTAEAFDALKKFFPRVSERLWNAVISVFGKSFRRLMKVLNDCGEGDFESQLQALVDDLVPEWSRATGCEVTEALLEEESWIVRPSTLEDAAGNQLRLNGRRSRKLITPLGEVKFRRLYYVGKANDGTALSLFPLDEALGYDKEHNLTPRMLETLALLGSKISFHEALRILRVTTPGAGFSLNLLERVSRTIGQQAEAFQKRPIVLCGKLKQRQTTVLAIDGGRCRMCSRDEPFREFKLAVVGELKDGEVHDKQFCVRFGEPDRLFDDLQTLWRRGGHERSRLVHVVGDGAPWIWNRLDRLKGKRQHLSTVLDYYHAIEHLHGLCNQLFGNQQDLADKTKARLEATLWREEPDELLTALRGLVETATGENRKLAVEELTYFTNQKSRLRYAECRRQGLPIGSGLVEGAVRFIGKDRLHRTGMSWTEKGAELVLQIRALDAGQEWLAFTKWRHNNRSSRLQALRQRWRPAA